MAKKIKGTAKADLQYEDDGGEMDYWFDADPSEPVGDEFPYQPAVLVLTSERVFTEREVKALVRDLTEASRGQWSPPSEGRAIAAKHGITID